MVFDRTKPDQKQTHKYQSIHQLRIHEIASSYLEGSQTPKPLRNDNNGKFGIKPILLLPNVSYRFLHD